MLFFVLLLGVIRTEGMVYKRQLIADRKLIRKLELDFELLESNETDLTKIYLDKETNSQWFRFNVDTEYYGGNPIFGKLPLPDIGSLIEIAINSEFEDEIFAACKILTEKEKDESIEFRRKLINKLSEEKDKQKQAKIVYWTALNSTFGKKPTD